MAPSAYRFETPQDARTFDTFSVANAVAVKTALAERGCPCEPYADVFTFRRWIAQGRAVRKGEHGIRLPIVVERVNEDKETGEQHTLRLLRSSFVFCRCQTDEAAPRRRS